MLNIAHIINHVMMFAIEAELAALYIMAQEGLYIRIVLTEMGHKQPSTPLQTDNATAETACNGKIQPIQTKAMDMRFHWLRDRQYQEQFRIYWRPGKFKLRPLLDEASSSNPPQTHKKRIHNTTHSGGNVKNRTTQSSRRSSSIKCSESENL